MTKNLENAHMFLTMDLMEQKEELNKITKEAIEQLENYGEKAKFLKQLAEYIQNRNK